MYDYEKATQIIEREFNDDDFFVSGSPPRSARLNSLSGRNKTDARRPSNQRGQEFGYEDQRGSQSYEKEPRSGDESRMFGENGGRNSSDTRSRPSGYDSRGDNQGRLDVGYDQKNGILSQSISTSFGDRKSDAPGRSFESTRTETRRASSPGNRGLAEGNGRSALDGQGRRPTNGTSSSYLRSSNLPDRDEPSYKSGEIRGRESDHFTNNRDIDTSNRNGRSTSDRLGSQSGARTSAARSTSKVVYDGEVDAKDRERKYYETSRLDSNRDGRGGGGSRSEEKEFLGKVQRELEGQRREWKDEIDRLTSSSLMPGAQTTFDALKNSVVDTSSGRAIFKAFIDVSEFPASSVKVNVDKIANKVVVEAKQTARVGTVAKTFTQRVQLPRFADEQNLVARMNKRGILKVEVPLIYYFPEADQDDGSKARSFVYEVRTDPHDGSKVMEILVNPGREFSTRDLNIEMADNDKMQIWAKKLMGSVGSLSPTGEGERTLIKQYTLPANADIGAITTRRNRDGCLAILVPIF